MAFDLKLLACMAFCVVMVQGRAGDPSNLRRDMILKALSQLREEKNYSPDLSEKSPYDEREGPMEVRVGETDGDSSSLQNQIIRIVEDIIGSDDCQSVFKVGFEAVSEEQDPLDDTRRYSYQERGSWALQTLSEDVFNRALLAGATAAFECLGSGNDVSEDDSESTDSVSDDERWVTENLATTDAPTEGTTEGTTTGPPEETDDSSETYEVERLVEKELLKDLLTKRIDELSKEGYNGKK